MTWGKIKVCKEVVVAIFAFQEEQEADFVHIKAMVEQIRRDTKQNKQKEKELQQNVGRFEPTSR